MTVEPRAFETPPNQPFDCMRPPVEVQVLEYSGHDFSWAPDEIFVTYEM
jgi:hypothetical protein